LTVLFVLIQAEALIREAAERNGRPLPRDWKLEPVTDEDDGKKEMKGNVLDLFKSKHMVR
jgi:hypothetical protein